MEGIAERVKCKHRFLPVSLSLSLFLSVSLPLSSPACHIIERERERHEVWISHKKNELPQVGLEPTTFSVLG